MATLTDVRGHDCGGRDKYTLPAFQRRANTPTGKDLFMATTGPTSNINTSNTHCQVNKESSKA